MRVAILSPAAELGGAERSLLTFLKAAQGTLVEAVVLLPREGPLAAALTRIKRTLGGGAHAPGIHEPVPGAGCLIHRQAS